VPFLRYLSPLTGEVDIAFSRVQIIPVFFATICSHLTRRPSRELLVPNAHLLLHPLESISQSHTSILRSIACVNSDKYRGMIRSRRVYSYVTEISGSDGGECEDDRQPSAICHVIGYIWKGWLKKNLKGSLYHIQPTLWDFKFSRRRVWCSELSSGMYCRVK
jgi:hypothetical protein